MLIDESDRERVVAFEHFEQGTDPRLRRPSRLGWQLDLKLPLPPEALSHIAENDQPFSPGRILTEKPERLPPFGIESGEPSVFVGGFGFGDLAELVLCRRLESAIQIRSSGLIDVDIETENQ
jgi:hypothetical protein